MTERSTKSARIWFYAAAILVVGLAAVLAYTYYNPFWLIDRGLKAYLLTHSVQDRYLEVDGNRIHYLEAKPAGSGPDKPIVLVHGLGARAGDWAPLIPALAAGGYHVFALDLLGYGESARPPDGDFTVEGEANLVQHFMWQAGIPRADLAGWSMGGWISTLLALEHPESVRRLLLFDSAGLYFDPDFTSDLFTPSDEAGLRRLTARIEPEHPILKIPSVAVSGMIRRLQANHWIVERSFRSMVSGHSVLDFRLSAVHLPVLIVWGTEDKLTPFSQAERLHLLMPQSVLAGFRGCGHLAAAECAQAVLPVVRRFLDADPPLPAARMLRAGRPGSR